MLILCYQEIAVQGRICNNDTVKWIAGPRKVECATYNGVERFFANPKSDHIIEAGYYGIRFCIDTPDFKQILKFQTNNCRNVNVMAVDEIYDLVRKGLYAASIQPCHHMGIKVDQNSIPFPS